MLHPGEIIGNYRIDAPLGRGGMGMVYAARRLDDHHLVAIKTLHNSLLVGAERDTVIQRFLQEAEIGMRLRHPSIIAVYEQGQYGDGLYLVMERINGEELRHHLTAREALPLGRCLEIQMQILAALAHAHQQGVIHRDIKPANILIRDHDDSVVIMDFGIARRKNSELTQPGYLLGSPSYMAPEQWRGERLDQRADLFSAGAVFYLMLTGQRPFPARDLSTLILQIQQQEFIPPSSLNPQLPTALDGILARALAKQAEQRFADATRFIQAVQQLHDQTLAEGLITSTPVDSSPIRVLEDEGEATTVLFPPEHELSAQISTLLMNGLTGTLDNAHLGQLCHWLQIFWALTEAKVQNPTSEALASLPETLLGEQIVSPLTARILAEAPIPGEQLQPSRGDWLNLVELFTLLQDIAMRLGRDPLEQQRSHIVDSLSRAASAHIKQLGQHLSSPDAPPLAPVSAALLRMEVLQLGLDRLASDIEKHHIQQALLAFARQVIRRVNAVLQRAAQGRDPLACFDAGQLLLEMEELIVLVEYLLTREPGLCTHRTPMDAVMDDFLHNTQHLAKRLTQELLAQLETEEQQLPRRGAAIFEAGQGRFIGCLRQLGMLYRLVIRLEPMIDSPDLRQLGEMIHHGLQSTSDLLLSCVETEEFHHLPAAYRRLWERLSIIAELAEQFGWSALKQQVLLGILGRLDIDTSGH